MAHGGVGTPHARGASGKVLRVSVDEAGSFSWLLWARRLVGSVTPRLDGPSAHRPSGRDPGTGVTSRRAIKLPNRAGGAFASLGELTPLPGGLYPVQKRGRWGLLPKT